LRSGDCVLHTPLAAILAASTLFAGSVLGSGTLDARVLVLDVEDAHGRDCRIPSAGFCFVQVEGDGAANTTIDAYQRIEYVGVATDFSGARQATGDVWLLPDGSSLMLRGSDLVLPHPVFVLVTEWWTSQERPPESDRLEMSDKSIRLTYVEPSWPPGTRPKTWELEYNDAVGYEQFGPYNRPTGNSTDNYLTQTRFAVCGEDDYACSPTFRKPFDIVPKAAPNVRWGLEWYDVQVALDPDGLSIPPAFVHEASLATWSQRKALDENQTLPGYMKTSSLETIADAELGAHPRQREPQPSFPVAGVPKEIRKGPPEGPEGGPSLAFVAGVAVATAVLAALGITLYSRFNNKAEALASEARARLLALIRENPGICLSDVAERMGVARNTIRHHLRVLERVQLVRVAKEGNLQVFYAVGSQALQAPAWLRRNETCLAILRAVAQSATGLAREEVHKLLPEVPDRTRNYHLKRLLSVGALVQAEDESGGKRLRVAPEWAGQGGASGTA
jgi:predicted transcriptional regulator